MNKRKKRITVFDFTNTLLVLIITLVILYPLYFCVIASFSSPTEIMEGNTLFWIKGFTLDSYKYAFREKSLWIGYRNTIVYTVLGTLYVLLMTIPASYALSKNDLPFRKGITWIFLFTMYFSGGMIPSYFLIKNLGLLDTPLVMIIGAGVSGYNLIITRQFFTNSIPGALFEAAHIDGANEWYCFTKIAVPLAKPIIAVIALWSAVGKWNSYFSALLYLRSDEYMPLQLVLREILINSNVSANDFVAADPDSIAQMLERMNIAEGMQYAIIIIACAPLLILFPFVQRYFTQGVTTGSVKE